MKMNKVILIMLLLLPFDMVFAESEPYPEQYWIDEDSVKRWSKAKVFPIKQGDYIVAEADYALRYCNSELTHYSTTVSSGRTVINGMTQNVNFERVNYICTYNGKPIRLTETIFYPS